MPLAATWMDPESVMISEVHQTMKEKYWMKIPYMWNLKRNDTNELTYKTDSQTSRMSL